MQYLVSLMKIQIFFLVGKCIKFLHVITMGTCAVIQLVEALRYKPEGRGVQFPMVSLEFF